MRYTSRPSPGVNLPEDYQRLYQPNMPTGPKRSIDNFGRRLICLLRFFFKFSTQKCVPVYRVFLVFFTSLFTINGSTNNKMEKIIELK